MKYNYLVYANDWGSDYFESLDEAMKFAKKRVHKSQEDVQIFTKSHVVKFPLPEMDVEEVKLLEAS